MMACLAAHDKTATDAAFLKFLPMIERGASDDRNFVKKGVSWALRHLGHRSAALHAAAMKTATRLSKSDNATERWVGKDALRDITRPAVIKKVRDEALTATDPVPISARRRVIAARSRERAQRQAGIIQK